MDDAIGSLGTFFTKLLRLHLWITHRCNHSESENEREYKLSMRQRYPQLQFAKKKKIFHSKQNPK